MHNLYRKKVSHSTIIWGVLTFFLLTILASSPTAYAQNDYGQGPTDPQQREDWLEWRLFSTLRNVLLPAYIRPESEADVQKWLGEVQNYKGEFTQINQHVVQMDRATRVRDSRTANTEANAAAEILRTINLEHHYSRPDERSNPNELQPSLQASASVSDTSIMDSVKNALNNANVQNLATDIGSQFGPVASALDLASAVKDVFQFTKTYTTSATAQQRMSQFFGQPANQVLSQLASAEANHLINDRPDLLAAGLTHGMRNLGNVTRPGNSNLGSGNRSSINGGTTHLQAGEGSKPPPAQNNKLYASSEGETKNPPTSAGGSGIKPPGNGGGNNKKPPSGSGGGSDEPPDESGGNGKKKPPDDSGPGGDGQPKSSDGGEKKPQGDNDQEGESPKNWSHAGLTTEASILRKLDTYLLDPEHKNAKGQKTGKADWFKNNLGFTRENMQSLASQIQFDPRTAVPKPEYSPFGIKYEQLIRLYGANGTTKDVPFIFIRNLDGIVRLVGIGTFPGKPKE